MLASFDKANIQNFEYIHRGLIVVFRTDRCLQMSLIIYIDSMSNH